MPNNRIQLVIAGVTLTISTTEEEPYVLRLTQTIDEDMQLLLSKTKASVTSAALLLAIDYLDRFQKVNVSATNMRTQIKGYLTDAANAKLLFDEEKKRSDTYAREVGELSSRLEQLQSTSSRGEDIKMLMEEHNTLLEERSNILSQLDYANNLLNTSIATREDEIQKLKNDIKSYLEQLELQSAQIHNYEQQLQVKQDDVDKLLSEVALLENLLKEYINEAETVRNASTNIASDFGNLSNDSGFAPETPPLFYQDPPREQPYEYTDMPNLNWTENL
ncbi:MAG: cell division protein ZapA [Oscillospiraceae bacterium]|nr:cell division protein ZapA [Oscillospiraceae bacterium]